MFFILYEADETSLSTNSRYNTGQPIQHCLSNLNENNCNTTQYLSGHPSSPLTRISSQPWSHPSCNEIPRENYSIVERFQAILLDSVAVKTQVKIRRFHKLHCYLIRWRTFRSDARRRRRADVNRKRKLSRCWCVSIPLRNSQFDHCCHLVVSVSYRYSQFDHCCHLVSYRYFIKLLRNIRNLIIISFSVLCNWIISIVSDEVNDLQLVICGLWHILPATYIVRFITTN